MKTSMGESVVFVEAPARLHFGVLDLRGGLGRWFGGIGAGARNPLLLSASLSERVEVSGQDADRAADFARRFLDHYQIRSGVRLRVERALPRHAGLGSGTQLALAVATALAQLHAVKVDAPQLARALGRSVSLGRRHVDVRRWRPGRRGRPTQRRSRLRAASCPPPSRPHGDA